MKAVKNSLPDDCGYKDYIGWIEAKEYWASWSSTEGGLESSRNPERAIKAAYDNSKDRAYKSSAIKKQDNYVRAILAF